MDVHSGLETVLIQVRELAQRDDALGREESTLEAALGRVDELAEAIQGVRDDWGALQPRDQATREAATTTAKRALDATTRAEQEEARLAEVVGETGDEAFLQRMESVHSALADRTSEHEQLSSEIVTLRARKVEKVSELDEARIRAKALADEAASARAAIRAAAQGLTAARETLRQAQERTASNRRLVELRHEQEKVLAAAEEARKVSEAVEADRQQARHALDRLLRDEHVAALRADLSVGDECPVCTQVIQTLAEAASHGDAEVAAARKSLDQAERTLQAKHAAFARALADIEAKARAIEEQEQELASVPDGPDVETAQADADHLSLEAEALGQRADAAQSEASTAAAAVSGLEAELRGLGARLDTAERQLKGLAEKVDEYTAVLRDELGTVSEAVPAEVASRRERLRGMRSAVEQARQQERTARETAERAQSERTAFEAESRAIEQRAHAFAVKLDGLRDSVPEIVGTPVTDAAETAEDTPAVIADRAAAQVDELRAAVTRRTDALHEERRSLRDEAAGRAESIGQDGVGRLPAAIAEALSQAHQAVATEIGVLNEKIERLTENMEKRVRLEGEVREKREQAGRYEKLGRDLRSNRFVQFILEETFHELALRASDQLHTISGGRYTLVPKELDFEVVDHVNADERRSVITLSGGETFLASLALALALSGGIRDLAGHTAASRIEAVFIDEGFGSLDAETLDTAIEALERLQEQERSVGVITHVQAVAERIPAGLEVRPGVGGAEIALRT